VLLEQAAKAPLEKQFACLMATTKRQNSFGMESAGTNCAELLARLDSSSLLLAKRLQRLESLEEQTDIRRPCQHPSGSFTSL